MHCIALVLLSVLLSAASAAAPLPAAKRAEIDALLSRLEASGCAFKRNGSWHAAAEARAHLARKLAYLEERGMVTDAETFVVLAASGSSLSGAPYLVRCGSDPPVESAAWLRQQLRFLRGR